MKNNIKSIRLGITIGDPKGIGPEVTVKALKKFIFPKDCEVFVFGDKEVLKNNGLSGKAYRFNLIESGAKSSKAGLEYLKKAALFLKEGKINCLVTAPVNKKSISLNNIKFCGHTEFLAQEFDIKDTLMMFVGNNLKLSLVTRHIPLKQVPVVLNKELVYKTILQTYEALKNYLNVPKPLITLCGLNPHASDDGIIGNEEQEIIRPAILKAQKNIPVKIQGPFAADGLFASLNKIKTDAVVCMYHDQGLIPFKMLCKNGVNLTVGLPFIRTSPTHGTAFDITGKNIANYDSMLAAIELAYKLTKNKVK